MSLLSSIVKKVAPIAATFGKFIPGVGTAVSALGTAASVYYGAKAGAGAAVGGMGSSISLPSIASTPQMLSMGMTSLARVLPGVGAVAGRAVGAGIAGAKRIYGAASNYCRKHPQWCSTIGGIAAVEAMIQRGELPIPKRRRGKGISATELKNFKRVARFTSKYCAPVRKAMKAPVMRRKASCQ